MGVLALGTAADKEEDVGGHPGLLPSFTEEMESDGEKEEEEGEGGRRAEEEAEGGAGERA